ncbi:cysteine desulfurase [Bacillus sp. FJAT-18017]|uniref:IscS subfamily cysteine desulfurase n=1 Tax=Bacillus sp. FJAT-18017 TaxID=1705566 RepID=UPI0006AEDB21|nr:IscS subfamily cysteine desulfurase [Bacillus sp. FJAT-18017]ALC89811.1 cysteine desulfurase [Bacillus sp. FJAT-18017]
MNYFDFAATTPIGKEALEVYNQVSIQFFGNPNSLHDSGGAARDIVEESRSLIAQSFGVSSEGVYFTSGGSEGNFLCLEALLSARHEGKHIITGYAEHSSVSGVLNRLENNGYEITRLPFTSSGTINMSAFKDAIRPDTVVAAIQLVNPEIGTIQPIKEIGALCKSSGILFHSDFVQAAGKIDIRPLISSVSSFSVSGHKLYGPKGIGCVYINPEVAWKPFFPGTSHEKGLRPGTLNVPAIAAMATAAEKAVRHIPENVNRFTALRTEFLLGLEPLRGKLAIFGSTGDQQYPAIIGLGIAGIEGQWLMLECNRLGYAISTGTACHSGMLSPSKTMQAIGIDGKQAKEFVRISFGTTTSENDAKKLAADIVGIAGKF